MAQLLFSGSSLTTGSSLELALQLVENRLPAWASNSDTYNALLLEVFGVQGSEATGALQAGLSGTGLGISLEILTGDTLSGINGAYTSAAAGGGERIYLNGAWLQNATAAEIEAVLPSITASMAPPTASAMRARSSQPACAGSPPPARP
jgi:hypothetical protein